MEYYKTQLKNNRPLTLEEDTISSKVVDDMELTAMTIVIALAALIGIWGVSCLTSGLIKSSSFVEFVMSWLSAVLGF